MVLLFPPPPHLSHCLLSHENNRSEPSIRSFQSSFFLALQGPHSTVQSGSCTQASHALPCHLYGDVPGLGLGLWFIGKYHSEVVQGMDSLLSTLALIRQVICKFCSDRAKLRALYNVK